METPKQDALTAQYPDEPLLFADRFDDAILGVTGGFDERRVVYSVAKILAILIKEYQDGSEPEDPEYDWHTMAREHFDFNIGGGHVGPQTPVWVEGLEEEL